MDDIGRTPEIRPRPTLGRRLDALARRTFPAACTVLLMLATAAPLGLEQQAAFLPAGALACVWFWSLFRPASMSPPIVFLVGALFDLIGYLPLGVGVLTLLIVHGFALRWRRVLVKQGFLVVWLSFVGVAAGGTALIWGLTSLITFQVMPATAALFQAILTVALYPALATLFTYAHRGIAAPELA